MDDKTSAFSAAVTGRRVARLAATGALASLGEAGEPHASLVTVALTHAGEPILLLSGLAVHTRNIERDRRVSLLLVEPGGESGDPLTGARLTIAGEIARDDDPVSRRRFLARHEEAALYADFNDFAFYRLHVRSAHLVAGFGRIVTLTAADLLVDCSDSAELIAAKAGAVSHMNADHADALRLYASKLCRLEDADWKATGCDPLGLDLRAGTVRGRVEFPAKVRGGGELRRTLVALAQEAREQPA